jgi:hypothetical protein
MKSLEIYQDLQGREQLPTECDYYGDIPQLEITLQDVEQAIKQCGGVDNNYINSHGFLASVYLNATNRLGVDTSEFEEGLFVEFN